jgi:hypothetical protein
MSSRKFRFYTIAAVLFVMALGAWILHNRSKEGAPEVTDDPRKRTPALEAATGGAVVNTGARLSEKGEFPINDTLELPFLGKVRCHARSERIQFTVNGRKIEWPFRMYYLPNGMFVRAEYKKPGATDYEMSPKSLEMSYRARGQSLVGFPEKPAPASFSKVLQSLYENEPFDRATKINITWVLRDGTKAGGKIKPWFIANIFGVSSGLMRVPEGDEGFLKYRILLTPEGEAVYTDNLL